MADQTCNMKTVARYFVGAGLVLEACVLSTNSAYYQSLYSFQIQKVMGTSNAVMVILMTILQSLFFGAGILTIANNPTGFQLI